MPEDLPHRWILSNKMNRLLENILTVATGEGSGAGEKGEGIKKHQLAATEQSRDGREGQHRGYSQ